MLYNGYEIKPGDFGKDRGKFVISGVKIKFRSVERAMRYIDKVLMGSK